MTGAPAGVGAIMSRIASIRSGPMRVSEIQDRFGWNLAQAVSTAQPEAATAAPATSTGNFTQQSSGAGLVTAAAATTASTTAAAATPVASATPVAPAASVPVASGTWVDRLPEAAKPWANQIQAAASQHGMDPAFMAAVFWTESNYRPTVVSEAGAIGMGQLMPATAEWLGVDPWDPAQNMEGSARYYRNLLDRFGSLELATASYFSGPGAVSRAGGIPTDRSQNYVDKVLGRRDYLNGTRATPP